MIRLEDVSAKDMTQHYFCGVIDNCQFLRDYLFAFSEEDINSNHELWQLNNYLSVIENWISNSNMMINYPRLNKYYRPFRSHYDAWDVRSKVEPANLKITDNETSANLLLYDNPFNPFLEHIKIFSDKSISDIKHMLLDPSKYKEFNFIDLFSLKEALHIYEDAVIRLGKENPNYKGNLLKAKYLYRICLLNKNFKEFIKLLDIKDEELFLWGYLTPEEAQLITSDYPECDFIEDLKDRYYQVLLNNLCVGDYTIGANTECISNNALERIRIK